MPAQPFGKRSGSTAFAFAAVTAFLNRPQLAPPVMQVIEIWATAEATIADIVSELVGGQPQVAVALLQAVDSQIAQRGMVLAAARQVLTPKDYELFSAAVASIGASRKIRHSFVHHLWGYSESLPESLVLVDPKYYNRHSAEQKKALDESKPPPALDLSQVFVWNRPDIEEAIDDSKRALSVVQALQDMSLWKFSGRYAQSLRRRLLADPIIQQRISKSG